MSPAVAGLLPYVDVDGTPLGGDALDDLMSLRVERELNLPARAVLTFVDHGFTYSAGSRFEVGTTVVVRAGKADSATTTVVFRGQVSGAAMRRVGSDLPVFTVTVDDPAIALTQRMELKSYITQSPTSIVQQIARRSGLAVTTGDGGSTFDYILQTVSDSFLLDEICRRSGLVWWYDPVQQSLQVLGYTDLVGRSAAVTLDAADAIAEYSVAASSLHAASADTRGWDEATRQPVTGQASTAQAPATSAFVSRFLAPESPQGTQSGQRTDASADHLGAVATAELDAMVRRSVVAEVTVPITPAIDVGGIVQVSDLGPLNGRYLVTRVEHEYSRHGFLTRFGTGEFGAPPLPVTGPTHALDVPALQSAIVTDLTDPENRGRVKVKLPAVGDLVDTTWARVAIIGGGASRGLVWLPEVGDEVVVGFQDGDVRRPVVLGGLVNADDSFPADVVTGGKHDVRRMTSRAGNIVEFGDAEGSERILLSVPAGPASVEIAKNGITVDSGTTPLRLKDSGGSVELDGHGTLTLKAKKVVIDASTELILTGGQKVSVSGAEVEAAARMTLTLTAKTKADLTATGVLALKGATVQVN